jgi:Domain of unknown function (DUF3598)
MGQQWQNFLKNLGEWRGSFSRITPSGEMLDSTLSLLTLSPKDELVEFRLRRYASGSYDDPPSQDYRQDYSSLGRQAVFFETGAFSKGSLQLAPYGDFGAEYGFIHTDRRSRLVQLFGGQGECTSLTLIREFRCQTDAQERPPLQVAQLLGVWRGVATTHYADWRDPETTETHLEVHRDGNQLHQQLNFAGQTIRSSAQIQAARLLFEQSNREMLLLSDGVSSHIPIKLTLGQPFFVEAGWLLSDQQRQRLIRSYNAKGEWVSATFVTETKE